MASRTPRVHEGGDRFRIWTSYEFIDPRNVDEKYLENSLELIRQLPLKEDVLLVITGDMNASDRQRVGTWYSDHFEAIRVGGQVTAKILWEKATEIDVLVLDAVALLPDLRERMETSVARLLAHEGYHLLLRQRREGAHLLMQGKGNDCQTATDNFEWIAALALEEWRIETALCRAGHYLTRPYDEKMGKLLADYAAAFRVAQLQFPDTSGHATNRVRALFNGFMSQAAPVLAAVSSERPLGRQVTTSDHWRSLVGESWEAVRVALADAPAADEPTDPRVLLSLISALVLPLETWLERLGYRFALEGGQLLLEVVHLPGAE